VKLSILSIGDELLSGEVVDTNAAFMADRLFRAGIRVARHLTVPDDEDAIVAALGELAALSDAVVVTGGLGPTPDDLTAAAAARAAGTELELSAEAVQHLECFAERVSGGLHPGNQRQAMVPKGCLLIPNPLGTACGFRVKVGGVEAFFLPGVPFEMQPMFEESVLPALARPHEGGASRVTLKLFGISEAAVAATLEGVLPADSPVQLAYCVQFPEIHVILRAADAENAALHDAAATVRSRLSWHLFTESDYTMDDIVASLFRQSGLTLALAESCTGGMIASRITAVAGSSAYFLEGNVTYSNAAKSRMLQVPPALIETHGAVSSEVARAMAAGARRAAGSDLALSVTGIAGPEGGTPEKPVGTVYIALTDGESCRAERFNFAGGRDQVREITCFTALDWLRRHLLSRL
jgi:nicotinamide-nucleotide amidase